MGGTSSDILGQLLRDDGTLLGDQFSIAQLMDPTYSSKPDLAYNYKMDEFLVVWLNIGGYPYARIVRPDGAILPEKEIINTIVSSSPVVAALPTASDNGQYLVVWGSEEYYGFAGRLLNGGGEIIPKNLVIYQTLGWQLQPSNPAITGSESDQEYLITWHEYFGVKWIANHIAGRIIRQTGIPIGDPKPFNGYSTGDHAVAAGDNGDYLAVFQHSENHFSEPFGIHGQLWQVSKVFMPIILFE
jgi:hypothetical protein